jgi:hypothetical protein
VNRRGFIALATTLPLLGAYAGEVSLPVELRGGRFFALPRTLDGRTFACWLDTDGSGFIFDWAVERFGLNVRTLGEGHRSAALPVFEPSLAFPTVPGGVLPLFEQSRSDLQDPILKGFAAQLGGSWFARRVWRLDFPGARVAVNVPALSPAHATTSLSFAGDLFPQLRVVVAGQSIAMSFDIAASVAYRSGFQSDGQPVTATSFIARDVFEAWRSSHPGWQVDRNVSSLPGVDRIVVPEVRVGAEMMADVAFTTRPGDDVFQRERVRGKLGANAYVNRVVVIDYPNGLLRL